MEKHLHIVCLDVPYPVNYGGVYDLFYKIKYLSEQNIKIHLHCFRYGRKKQQVLNKYCYEVNYYPRKSFLQSFSFTIPYIVSSRRNTALAVSLLQDKYPILLEGIHCTYTLYKQLLQNRKILVRLHNIEHKYYLRLCSAEKNILKKIYFNIESVLLKSYEKKICKKASFYAVSLTDCLEYKKLGATDVHYLPVFTSSNTISSSPGNSGFCLYHGKLSVSENIKAVEWLMEIIKDTTIPLVIAGQDPHKDLISEARENGNICIIANPTCNEMEDLIRKAHVNILPSFNDTGVKIKLIESLFMGKHCVTNAGSISDDSLNELCHTAGSTSEMRELIQKLITTPFSDTDISKRKQVLEEIYDNEKNALQLIQAIW